MSTHIRRVVTHAEREAVFRLRYEVYVRELGRAQHHADHSGARIEEPLDAAAVLFLARTREGDAVGTVRCNYVRDGGLAFYESLYQMERVHGLVRSGASVTTKMIVGEAQRNSSLAYRLAAAAYQQGLRDGISHDFIDVYPARVPFFTRLGYRVHVPATIHPEFGPVTVMALAMHDADHLAQVGSPLLRFLRRERRAA
jgi:hypothetical protein